MNDLMLALREALAATQACNPAELDVEDLNLWHLCDARIEQIIECLVVEHDEAGPSARQLLSRFMLPSNG